MVEKIIENVINEMSQHLSQEQLEHLSNVLYVNFHGCGIQETCTDLTATGIDGDEAKIRMFVASKRAVNRQIKTLKHYTREIYQVKEFLGKRLEDITGMDLRYYYGILRERRGMPIEQVKEFLGHEKLDTTMIYCTVKEEHVHASHRKYA